LRNGLKYTSKKTHAELYEEFKTHHNQYTSKEALRDIYHEFHLNKCLCTPRLAWTRLGMWHIISDSLIFWVSNKIQPQQPITATLTLGMSRETCRACRNLTVIKQKRVQQKSDRINEGKTLMTRNNVQRFAYSKGMAGPQADNPERLDDGTGGSTTRRANGTGKAKASICPYCNKKGHKTTNSKNCDHSTVVGGFPHYREDNNERATGKLCRVLHSYVVSKHQNMCTCHLVQKEALLATFQGARRKIPSLQRRTEIWRRRRRRILNH
jgi:hypothetical protein